MTHILLMEDDAEFAFELRSHLEKNGYDVSWSRNAKDALDVLKQHDIDLLITDIYIYVRGKITDDGGITLIGTLRAAALAKTPDNLSAIPIIAISAAPNFPGNKYILATAETVGAHYTLEKPIVYQELDALIVTALGSKVQ